MIFDRTQSDVDNAIKIRDEKIKNFAPLTDADITTLERGMMTINTLNRIEEKQNELKNILNGLGYWNTPITTRTWDMYDVYDVDNHRRILNNLDVLRDGYYVYSNTPPTPAVSYHYTDINALEKILYDIEQMAEDMTSNYRYCGSLESGEE